MSRFENAGFRSEDSRRRYLAVYDRIRSLSPTPDVVHDVPTEFGIVRAYQHGPDGGVAMMLLHSFCATSAMWADHVRALTDDFTIYTVDLLGQPGASVQSKSMRTADDCASCIGEVLERLGLRDVHLAGHSYGGWTAMQAAARARGRLASVTLVEPGNTVARFNALFWRNGVQLFLPGDERKKRILEAFCGNPPPGSQADSVITVSTAAGGEFVGFGTPFPRYPSDSLLRSIGVPVQVLLAGNTIHDPGKAIDRIRTVVPSWTYRVWANSSHMLPCEIPEEVSQSIRDFVRQRC